MIEGFSGPGSLTECRIKHTYRKSLREPFRVLKYLSKVGNNEYRISYWAEDR
jgi:hypothetical protein